MTNTPDDPIHGDPPSGGGGSVPATGAGSSGRPPLSPRERQQRNIVIGLSIGAVVVLLVGVVAFAVTRGDNSSSSPDTSPVTTLLATTTPTVSTTTTTSTTSTTTTTTTIPIVAVAEAGPDVDASFGGVVTLTAMNLSEGTPPDAVRWNQVNGPDVTGGVGALGGPSVSFGAPAVVTALAFELEVAGTDGVATDDLTVRVFEDVDRMAFVDGERGSDGGDGTRAAPFASIRAAVAAGGERDVYVRSAGTYDESAGTVVLGPGVSLYGGFDENWIRTPDVRVVIQGAPVALRVEGPGERWLSAVEITGASASAGGDAIAVVAANAERVHIESSRIVAGDGGPAAEELGGGRSVGVLARDVEDLIVGQTTINSGRGGAGLPGGDVGEEIGPGDDGNDANERSPGSGGDGGGGRREGGDGGRGGRTSPGEAAPGGAAGGTDDSPDGRPGQGGAGGSGGRGGDGGSGLVGNEPVVPIGAPGFSGDGGETGVGAGGGGGGFGPLLVDGGGGGGGGAGGGASEGAPGGGGGGGSIGLWTFEVDRVLVVESLIAGGRGGDGGTGSTAAAGGRGGDGGSGAPGISGIFADGGPGGGGGGAGAGGGGGQGGGGAGGPSFGMLTSGARLVQVEFSTIRGGAGGAGAAGGIGGRSGSNGDDGSGRDGGGGGIATEENPTAEQGIGASGGASFGWFDDAGADRVLDGAEFVEGTPGSGGAGSTRGDPGIAVSTNE